MDGRRDRRGRGRGRGRGRWNCSGSGSEGAGRWSPHFPSFRSQGRWSPHFPSFRSQPQPQPQPPPPPPSVGDDVCGSGSNEEVRRKTCSEDDTSTPGSGSVGGSGHANNNKNNMKTHDGDGDADAMMIPPPQCTTPALDNNIQNDKDENSSTLVTLTDDDSSFDICRPTQQAQAATTVVLKPPLLLTNRERRNQIKRTQSTPLILRPGMLLFKAHISLSDQVKIVQRCRELGKGSGGFYQPGYREGTKLHLKMMCLGKHWDPQSGQYYAERRPCDGATPPHIPPEFLQLVRKAIAESHAPLQAQDQMILPPMSPDICIVNFYSHNGRLGLHQDKDESPQSLRQGLPVVSFSIGDSAEFLYGDDRDVDKAQKLTLESGDVLIFGGDSRNIFHGVSAIHQMTAPTLLLQQTNLRPGRLNLTFRQY